jgi:hypothetical protein
LMLKNISMKEDIRRAGTGAYSPGLRDDAQRARDSLAEWIRSTPGKEAFLALVEIGKAHPEEAYKPWFTQQAKSKAESDADLVAWTPIQVREFHEKLERTPENHRDLADLAHLRLLDLKDDLENGDSSIAAVLQGIGSEVEMRKFIGNTLRDKAFGRFSIPQEEEFADAKRPDLRFHGAGFDGPIPCELKLVDNNWSGAALFERMENQLCGDYLRDNRSSRGFFILVYQGRQKTWRVPGATKPVDFEALVISLRDHWKAISSKYECVEQIEVIGIDLTKRSK